MNHNIDNCVIIVNELWINICVTFDNKHSLILCSSTVKEPVPVIVECTKQPFYYTGTMPNCILEHA